MMLGVISFFFLFFLFFFLRLSFFPLFLRSLAHNIVSLLESLMRYSMALRVSPAELALAKPAAMTCSKHLSIINDIWSYEKEMKASQTAHEEGGVMCSSVAILASDTGLLAPAAKRVLWTMCREWEYQFKDQARMILKNCDAQALRDYLLGLEHQMSGNEMWSATTKRYTEV